MRWRGTACRNLSEARDELDDARHCFSYKHQDHGPSRERFNFLEQRGGADLELLGGRRPVAVVPLKRREDVLALHVPQWPHVL